MITNSGKQAILSGKLNNGFLGGILKLKVVKTKKKGVVLSIVLVDDVGEILAILWTEYMLIVGDEIHITDVFIPIELK